MKKIIYLSIVLLVVSLFLISIGFSSPTFFNNQENENNKIISQQQDHLEINQLQVDEINNNINNNNNKFEKSINKIINKGYKKLVDGLKLKSQFHNDEERFQKRAMEKQKSNPTGYKCQHDSIVEKRFEKVKKTQLKKSIQKNILKKKSEEQLFNVGDENLKVEKAAVAASAPIRFQFDTSFISDTHDPYACYKVGDKISVGSDTGASLPCVPDGSNDPCVYTCTEADIQTTELQNFYKNNIIETIKEVFESTLLVRNPVNNFKFNYDSNQGSCDYGVPIPESFYTQGVSNTDIYVWVTSRPTSSNNTIAYAFSCNFDTPSMSLYGRPTAASINFNPMFFSPFIGSENSISFNEYVRVGIHEMTHALGFSSNFFNSFVEPNTNNVIRGGSGAAEVFDYKGKTPSGKSFTTKKSGIYSSNVVSFARQHYGCNDIEYQELEDYGGSGTAGSHWESRTAGEEYMLGFVSPIMPITNLSLSLLKDSGWYEIVDGASEPLVWGKGLGCDFVQKPCSSETWNFQGYYCTENGATSCTGTRMGKGVCRIVTGIKDWPDLYQHFSDPKLTGYNLAADGCPFYQVQDNNVYCFDTSKQSTANGQVFETYCENCRCFEYQDSSSEIQQACWEQRCGDNGLQIRISNDWVDCPDSQTIVSNNVTIVCPIGYTICGGSPQTVVVTGNPASIILPTFILILLSLISLYLFNY